MKKRPIITWRRALLGFVPVLLAATGALGLTAPRFGPKLLETETALKIYAYQYPPLVDARIPGQGAAADIVQTALEAANVKVQIEVLPIRSLAAHYLLDRNGVAMLGEPRLFSGSERAKLTTLPCYSMTGAYYYYRPLHKEGINWGGDLKSLKGYRYGALQGEELAPYKKAGIKVATDDIKQLFKKLKAGQLDFIGLPDLVAREYLEQSFPGEAGNFVTMKGAAWQAPFALIFNDQHPRAKQLKKAYQEGLGRIRENGKYQAILKSYSDNGQVSETYLPAARKGVIEFGSSDTPPFYSPGLAKDGMAGEIVHALLAESGMKGRIHYFPLKRLLTDLRNNHLGDPDNFAGQKFSAIVPVALYRTAFFYYRPRHPKGMQYRKPEDLNGYKIGMIRGTLENRSYFDNNAIKVSEADSVQTLFRQLKEGRIDLCGVIRETGLHTVKQMYPAEADNFVPLEIPKSTGPITIMIDADYPDGSAVGAKIDEALKRIIKNGKYLQILEKYYGKGKVPADWFAELERYRTSYRRNQESGQLEGKK